MFEDDQTKAAASTRGTDPQPTDRTMQTMSATAAPAATPQGGRFQMPWQRQGGGMPWGQPQGQPGNTGVVGPGQGQPMQGGGHPGFGWGGMGGQGQGGMPNWQALMQQFQQRFQQNHPMLGRMGMTGQGMQPPGQAPAAPPQGAPMQPPPGQSPPIYGGPQAAQGMPQGQGMGGPLQGRLQQLAQMFGRNRQPGGIVGPGQGGQGQ